MRGMARRAVVCYGLVMTGLFFAILILTGVSGGEELAKTAAMQSSYKLTVASTRGTIYDCNLNAMTGLEKEYTAAVVPGVQSTAALNRVLSPSQMGQVYETLSQGQPFTLRLPQKVDAKGVDVFVVDKRYSEHQEAAHILGYLNGSGEGAAGVEKAFNDVLSKNQGRITVSYRVDALNRVLAGEQEEISDTTSLERSGVVLTLDQTIQAIAERAADSTKLTKAGILVLEVPSGKIRAMVSRPNFSPENVAAVLKSPDSPLLNRCMSAYSVGSVFKLVSAAAALEYGISPDYSYTCTGAINVDGGLFHCFNGESHGKENMKQAIANSCNAYFVNLMQQVPPQQFLLMAQSLGFGRSSLVAPGIASDPGILPTLKSLAVPRALANFSFGQGDLTATPLQIAALVNAVASGGVYSQPTLYEGTVDQNLKFTDRAAQAQGTRVMTESTARLLQTFMQASIEVGTSNKGKPDFGGAGAKTATAQTGHFTNGVENVESWFAGFYPYDHPKYVVCIFAEGGSGGGTTCGPAFRQIADNLYALMNQKALSATPVGFQGN
jgi:penicillin-binding protein 2